MADGSQSTLSRFDLPWGLDEERTLRRVYPVGGLAAAQAALPHRSGKAIFCRASRLGLSAPRGKRPKRTTYPHSAEIDAKIRAELEANPGARGLVAAIAADIARPTWYVARRAATLGLTTSRTSRWSEAELQLLSETSSTTARHASDAFQRRGFYRTAGAIALQRRIMKIERGEGGVHHVAGMAGLLGVTAPMLTRAIRLGHLKAKRDQGESPNDTRVLIHERHVREWIIANPYAVDLRKIPADSHAWFVSMLAGSDA